MQNSWFSKGRGSVLVVVGWIYVQHAIVILHLKRDGTCAETSEFFKNTCQWCLRKKVYGWRDREIYWQSSPFIQTHCQLLFCPLFYYWCVIFQCDSYVYVFGNASVVSILCEKWKPAKRMSPFKSGRSQFSQLLAVEECGSAVVMVVMLDRPCSEAEWKSTGYPLYLPVSPSLPLLCVTLCHQVSTELYPNIIQSLNYGGYHTITHKIKHVVYNCCPEEDSFIQSAWCWL